jgi:hypothetical protein
LTNKGSAVELYKLKSIRKRFVVVGSLVVFFLATLFVYINLPRDSSKISLAEIEAYLGKHIPNDAIDIVVTGKSGYKPYFSIRFKTLPQSMIQFTNNICDGVLHQSYNPFNAVDTVQMPPQRPYLIKLQSFTYFSYSLSTPDTIWGNRCWPFRKGLYQVLVDKGNPDLYALELEVPENCEKVAACTSIGSNYIEPVSDIPLIVIGMLNQDKNFILISNEVCMETQLGYELSTGWTQIRKWKNLINAQVDVWLDDKPLETAYISNDGRLTKTNNTPDSFRYDYCFTRNWSEGIHKIKLQIKTNIGQNYDYSWDFLVE